jgi:predicted nucleic acid-binding protein
MNAVDTNVLVYSIDRRELLKRKQAHELLRRLIRAGDTPHLLWQVAGELLS